jgi:hypothetical protein
MKGTPMIVRLSAPLLLAAVAASAASAQEEDRAPPQNARSLSEIVALVEKRDGFRYVDEIDWDEDEFWEVTYFTNGHARVEVRYDPVTGDPG